MRAHRCVPRSKLFLSGLGGRGFGKGDVPDIFVGLQGEEANLIGFVGADLADPHDAKTGFAPEAADFDGLTGRGEKTDAVEASTLLTKINGISSLGEGMAFGIGAFDDHAKSLGNTGLLASFFPKVWNELLESQADVDFAVGVDVDIGYADFLLGAAALVNEKNGVSDSELGFQSNEGAAGIDHDRLGFLVEGATLLCESINDDGHAEGKAHTRARGSLRGGRGEGHGERSQVFPKGEGVVKRRDLNDFFGDSLLGAVLATLKVPGLLEDLLEGLFAVGDGDPGVAVAFRATEPNGKIPRHVGPLQTFIIAVPKPERG
jgi:hypothetical protein